MEISLNCFQRDQHGNCVELPEWNFNEINTKNNLNNKYREKINNFIEFRNQRRDKGVRFIFLCSCDKNKKIEMSIVFYNNQYHMRDLEVGKHLKICPFFTEQRNNATKRISFNASMFLFPSSKEESKNISSQIVNCRSGKQYSKQTFEGVILCIFDNVNINLNFKNDFSAYAYSKNFIGEFLNFPLGGNVDETFSSFRKNLSSSTDLYFDVGFIKESSFVINKDEWCNKSKKYLTLCDNNGEKKKYQINKDFINNISNKKYSLGNSYLVFNTKNPVITSNPPIVKHEVLQKTLGSLMNYDNIVNGPYFYTAVRSNLDNNKTKIVQFVVQPMYIGKSFLVPVESNFERKCLSYLEQSLDSNYLSMYKPMTKQGNIFFKNLKLFLEDYPKILNEYIARCRQYSKKKYIRPDLFLIFRNKLYIFEFAGYMGNEFYRNKLEKKEREFYNYLDGDITYVRIQRDTMIEDFIHNGF